MTNHFFGVLCLCFSSTNSSHGDQIPDKERCMPFDAVDAAAVGNDGGYGELAGVDAAELASAASPRPTT